MNNILPSVWNVYVTDEWHTTRSKKLIAVTTDKLRAINFCLKYATKDNEFISQDDLYFLENINQTQNYLGDGQFVIEEIYLNEIIG